MREYPRIQDMFEYYYMLGEDRTLQAVADHYNISRVTVSKYNKEFRWEERVKSRDLEVYKDLQQQNNDDIRTTLESYHKVIKASVAAYISRLKSNKIKVDTVRDFVRLVELDMKICGFEAQLFETKISEAINHDISGETCKTLNTLIDALNNKIDDGGGSDGGVQ